MSLTTQEKSDYFDQFYKNFEQQLFQAQLSQAANAGQPGLEAINKQVSDLQAALANLDANRTALINGTATTTTTGAVNESTSQERSDNLPTLGNTSGDSPSGTETPAG